MPLYKVTLSFFVEGDSALDAFSYASQLEVLEEGDAAIPAESVTTHVEFCVEEEVQALAADDLPDNIKRIH